MRAYTVADQNIAKTLTFVREDRNKDRLYTYAARSEEQESAQPGFFYRATTAQDANNLLRKMVTVNPNGHQGWASYRGYSLTYLTRGYGYTHLIEVKAPDFIPWMREIGWVSGKAEDGDMSWGIGEGLPMIGKLLGHTQVQTTARYAHLANGSVSNVLLTKPILSQKIMLKKDHKGRKTDIR